MVMQVSVNDLMDFLCYVIFCGVWFIYFYIYFCCRFVNLITTAIIYSTRFAEQCIF